MPLATAHLVALAPSVSVAAFLRALAARSVTPLVTSRVVRWIIKPERLSVPRLLDTAWDLFLILPSPSSLPPDILGPDWLRDHWTITAGVPRALVADFADRNRRLLHPQSGDVPALTGALDTPRLASSTQGLELTDDLLRWSDSFALGRGAVSMLNLLAFHPGPAAHESYLRYGRAFAESIGSRRGGNAKVVGKVVAPKRAPADDNNKASEDVAGWDEIALAHYPSIRHFLDMLASDDYQEVNHRDRLPALRDTCILCTTELDPELGGDAGKARL